VIEKAFCYNANLMTTKLQQMPSQAKPRQHNNNNSSNNTNKKENNNPHDAQLNEFGIL